ncbi:hypothetical protein MKW92_039572, partial [Papaver armeniacum]
PIKATRVIHEEECITGLYLEDCSSDDVLVSNSSLALQYFWSRGWQQLFLVARHKSCNKYFIKTAGYFIVDMQHLFKQLQTSISNGTITQGGDELINSRLSISAADNSIKGHITRIALHKFEGCITITLQVGLSVGANILDLKLAKGYHLVTYNCKQLSTSTADKGMELELHHS